MEISLMTKACYWPIYSAMAKLFHITSLTEWDAAQTLGKYITSSLAKDGFIHCSLTNQILGVANFKFKGQAGLILLEINQSKVEAPIKFEDLYNLDENYPHIYGALNLDDVFRVLPFQPKINGTFELPSEILS